MAHNDEWWENEYYKALDRDLLREYDEQMNREEFTELFGAPAPITLEEALKRVNENADRMNRRILETAQNRAAYYAEDLIDSAFVRWDEEQQPTVSWWAD